MGDAILLISEDISSGIVIYRRP